MERLTNVEIEAIRKRVEDARECGHGVGGIVFGDVPKLLAEIERLRTGIIHVIEETSCDDTWDYLNRMLDGEGKSELRYRIGGNSE